MHRGLKYKLLYITKAKRVKGSDGRQGWRGKMQGLHEGEPCLLKQTSDLILDELGSVKVSEQVILSGGWV